MKNHNSYDTRPPCSRIRRQQRQFHRNQNLVGMHRHAGRFQQQHPELRRRHPERRHQPDVLHDGDPDVQRAGYRFADQAIARDPVSR